MLWVSWGLIYDKPEIASIILRVHRAQLSCVKRCQIERNLRTSVREMTELNLKICQTNFLQHTSIS